MDDLSAVPIVLVGNKSDLHNERRVTVEEGKIGKADESVLPGDFSQRKSECGGHFQQGDRFGDCGCRWRGFRTRQGKGQGRLQPHVMRHMPRSNNTRMCHIDASPSRGKTDPHLLLRSSSWIKTNKSSETETQRNALQTETPME